MPLSAVRVAVFCLPLVLIASCGEGSEAIQGTRVNISPISVGVTSPASNPAVVSYIIQTYQIELRSPTGNAQINTNLTIANRGTLYAGSVVIDRDNVTCTALAVCTDSTKTPQPSTYETTTDSNGSIRVTMLFGFISGADGTATVLEALSGTGYGKTDIIFTCVDGTAVCP